MSLFNFKQVRAEKTLRRIAKEERDMLQKKFDLALLCSALEVINPEAEFSEVVQKVTLILLNEVSPTTLREITKRATSLAESIYKEVSDLEDMFSMPSYDKNDN